MCSQRNPVHLPRRDSSSPAAQEESAAASQNLTPYADSSKFKVQLLAHVTKDHPVLDDSEDAQHLTSIYKQGTRFFLHSSQEEGEESGTEAPPSDAQLVASLWNSEQDAHKWMTSLQEQLKLQIEQIQSRRNQLMDANQDLEEQHQEHTSHGFDFHSDDAGSHSTNTQEQATTSSIETRMQELSLNESTQEISTSQAEARNESSSQQEVPSTTDEGDEEYRADIEEQLQGIKDSNAHIETIEKHLQELVSLTRREGNKFLIFRLQAMELFLSLLQTKWSAKDAPKVILPILSILSNLALSTEHRHLPKLLDQEGVMEQLWLLLKLHIQEKTLAKSLLTSINTIGTRDTIMPFFAKHPMEMPILFSLVNPLNENQYQGYKEDMRMTLLVLQGTASALQYASSSKQPLVFDRITEPFLNQLFDWMHQYEFNQRLILSCLEIIAQVCEHSSASKENVNRSKLQTEMRRCIHNFKRDSALLSKVLRCLLALNPEAPLQLFEEDADTKAFLKKHVELLVKLSNSDKRPDTHCIPLDLFAKVFPAKGEVNKEE